MATKETTTIVIMTSACFADPARVACLLDILERMLAPTTWGTDPAAREPYRRETVIESATHGRDGRALFLARRRPMKVRYEGWFDISRQELAVIHLAFTEDPAGSEAFELGDALATEFEAEFGIVHRSSPLAPTRYNAAVTTSPRRVDLHGLTKLGSRTYLGPRVVSLFGSQVLLELGLPVRGNAAGGVVIDLAESPWEASAADMATAQETAMAKLTPSGLFGTRIGVKMTSGPNWPPMTLHRTRTPLAVPPCPPIKSISSRPIRLAKGELRALRRAVETDEALIAERFPDVDIEEVVQPFVTHLRILAVQSALPRPGMTCHVAIRQTGEAVVLSGHLSRWNQLNEGTTIARLDDATSVKRYAIRVDEWTTGCRLPEFTVNAFADIYFFPHPTPEQQTAIVRLRAKFGAEIGPLRVVERPDGWDVVSWTVSLRRLIERTMRISTLGQVERLDVVHASEMPVHSGEILQVIDGRAVPIG